MIVYSKTFFEIKRTLILTISDNFILNLIHKSLSAFDIKMFTIILFLLFISL